MKKFSSVLGMAMAAVCLCGSVSAQYKAPSQYFRKDFPAPNKPGAQPAAPSNSVNSATAAQPKFKDLPVNSMFYFTTDTNRAYPWTKISTTAAKNTKGVTQNINAEIQVRR